MHARTALAAALLALAAATAGCGSDSSNDEPSKSDKPAASASPSVDEAAALQACVDAVADIPAGDNGEVPSEPVPDECADLDEGDYLDAYMDGIEQSNEQGRDDLQDAIDEASKASQP
ncbi:hypothetical protein [Streptomyces sp. NPDC047070]|uniref:hypothetical protein n=1 Tax=Streptomyces sp. NPDC047070 TaxID=3154923 RepID=UPI003452D9FE